MVFAGCGSSSALIAKQSSVNVVSGSKRAEGSVVIGDNLAVGCHRLNPWGEGVPCHESSVTMSQSLVESIGTEKLLAVVRAHTELAHDSNAYYGFLDYSPEIDTLEGSTYGSIFCTAATLRATVEQSIWLQKGLKQQRVRGVFWGNYLSNELLRHLGGDFIDAYEDYAMASEYADSSPFIWRFDRGVFFSIGPEPNEYVSVAELRNVDWLVDRFTEAGLL